MIMSMKQRKLKIEPRIKFSHKIYNNKSEKKNMRPQERVSHNICESSFCLKMKLPAWSDRPLSLVLKRTTVGKTD